MPQPWLVDVKRRTLMDIKESLRPSQIYRLITAKTWPYKTQMEFYHARDRTLMVLLYLTCGRVTEFLSLKKSQFVLDEDPDFARARVIQRRLSAHFIFILLSTSLVFAGA